MVTFAVCRGGYAIADTTSTAGGGDSSTHPQCQQQHGSGAASLRFSLQSGYSAHAHSLKPRTWLSSAFASMAIAHAIHVGPPNGVPEEGSIVSQASVPLFSLAR